MKCLVSKESVLPYPCRWGSEIRKSPIRQVDRGQFFTMTEIPRLAFRVSSISSFVILLRCNLSTPPSLNFHAIIIRLTLIPLGNSSNQASVQEK